MRRLNLLLPAFLLFFSSASAQFCTPNTANYCCSFGISNITFAGINNNSGDGANGYEDFTAQQATVFAGQAYTMSVSSASSQPQNYRVWIDYNNDQVFDPVNEIALELDDITASGSGTINIPATAVPGTPLRMRVSADWNLEDDPEPCVDLVRGQAEDYTILVSQSTDPPTAGFSVSATTVCSGIVDFTDASSGIPTNWYWEFGDGNTSTQQNPTHTYTSSGTFSVTLITSNVFGSDTVSQPNYITVDLSGLVTAASCTPQTTAHCCDYGIYDVQFAGINKSSAGGEDGYQDYSCGNTATVTEGLSYTMTVETGAPQPEDVSVWIDLNNDGVLNDTTELVWFSTNEYVHTGALSIPGGAVLNTSLRMRIMSDFVGNTMSACGSPQWGQAEDYAIVIEPNTDPPIADFSANSTNSCDGIVSFTDESVGFPTSWAWDFGDGNTSTDQNPTHVYGVTGNFTISLTVTNQFGSDTETKFSYVSVESVLGGPPDANCEPQSIQPDFGIGIYNVTIGTIDHTTASGIEGYQDFSCQQQTELAAGETHSIFVETGNTFEETVVVWIDFDNNGVFNDLTERVFTSEVKISFHLGDIYIPDQNVPGGIPLRMRVASDFAQFGGPLPGPCNSPIYGQVEDYSVILTGEIGVPEVNLADRVQLAPNPAHGSTQVRIDLNSPEEVTLSLYTPVGQLVRTELLTGSTQHNHRLSLDGLSSGIYHLEVKTDTGRVVKKLIVQ